MSLLLSPQMQPFDCGFFRHRPGQSGTITGGYTATIREHAFLNCYALETAGLSR